MAQEELLKSQTRQKRYYARKTRQRRFRPGDKVLVLLPTNANKLLMQWKGPFEVIAVTGLFFFFHPKLRVIHSLASQCQPHKLAGSLELFLRTIQGVADGEGLG